MTPLFLGLLSGESASAENHYLLVILRPDDAYQLVAPGIQCMGFLRAILIPIVNCGDAMEGAGAVVENGCQNVRLYPDFRQHTGHGAAKIM